MRTRRVIGLLLLTAGLLLAADRASGQAKKSDSVVKAKATAGKIGDDGKQAVTIELSIAKKFHLYANPVGNDDFTSNQTSVSITGKNKLEGVKIDYPEGELVKDKVVGDYKVYKDKATIKATVTRGKGDAGPLTVKIKVQACDATRCLEPGTITLSVP